MLVSCLSVFDLHAPRVTLSHALLISTHRHWRPSASSKGSRYFSIPNMRALTGLINSEAHGAYASRISTQVLHHLLRAAERGRCEVNRGICLPAAQPRWPSSHWQNKTSQQSSERWVAGVVVGRAGPSKPTRNHAILEQVFSRHIQKWSVVQLCGGDQLYSEQKQTIAILEVWLYAAKCKCFTFYTSCICIFKLCVMKTRVWYSLSRKSNTFLVYQNPYLLQININNIQTKNHMMPILDNFLFLLLGSIQ